MMIDKITKFFNWFISFLSKPLGVAVWSIILILAGVYYSELQIDKTNNRNEIKLQADNLRIKQLENKIDTLSNKLANRDCSDEIQRYVNLIQNIQIQTSQTREEKEKRLEIERKKTEELKNLKTTLNIK